jgi:hypothetical protein
MQFREGINEHTFLIPDGKGHVFFTGRGFRGDEAVRSRKREELRKLIYEWIDSGKRADGSDLPQERNLHSAPDCREVVQRFIAEHKIQVTAVVSAPIQPRVAIQSWFRDVRAENEVAHVFTRFFDSDLATRLHVCRNPTCGKLFIGKPRAYERGTHCCGKCGSALTARFAKKVALTMKLANCRKWCHKGIDKNLKDKGLKDFVAEHSGASKKFVTEHWEDFYYEA